MINNLITLLKDRDYETYIHSCRVANLSVYFSLYLLKTSNYKIYLTLIYESSLLHDFGKLFLDKDILHSTKKLSNTEFEHIKLHPIYGYDFIKSAYPKMPTTILNVIKYHHLGCDKSGYPVLDPILDNIPSFDILYINIITICDVYDALINKRTYKESLSIKETFMIMDKMSNKFDEDLYANFKNMILSENKLISNK